MSNDLATKAEAAFDAEVTRAQQAFAKADALATYILDNLQSEELSTHVEFSFEPNAAAMIANMAEGYRAARAGETPSIAPNADTNSIASGTPQDTSTRETPANPNSPQE